MSDSSSKTPIGAIGRYQILERIGEGGMGSLYMARDPAIERLLAIKVLRSGFDTDELRERFSREARAAGRLRHPNIVTIFDVGEHDGDPFIAMEFLPGETLGELIRSGARLALARRLKLLEELCDGLGYAHRAGIVHRDVKPANLMVDAEGTLKILDFGIVRLGESGMTQAGMLVGTVNYMSPEQVMGGAIDARSDIFAVGAVAYELLSYKQAFPGTLAEGLFNRILNSSVVPLAQLCPSVDPSVIGIVERALKKEPGDRYQELAKMRNDLARIRQRLEAETDAMNARAGEEAGETIVYSSATPAPSGPYQVPPIAEAERAFAKGDYRAALTLAGRSAALNPDDTHASTIVHRAHAALLERGREAETLAGVTRSSSATATPPPTTPAPVTPTAAETSAVVPTTGTVAAGGSNMIALAVAGVALVIAAIAVFMRVDRGPATVAPQAPAPVAQTQAAPTQPAPAPAPPPAAAPVTEPTTPLTTPPPPVDTRANRPTPQVRESPRPAPTPSVARPAEVPPPAPTSRVTAPLRAPTEIAAPRRIRNVEAAYPEQARAQRVQGTVVLELTIGRDGHVADARIVNSVPMLDQAALTAVRQWEYAPTIVDGNAVPIIQTVSVPFTIEAAAAQAATPPEAPRASAPPPRPTESTPREVPAPPAAARRDPAADANAVREALRRYEAAWEALDFAALSRARQLSAAESASVRDTMANARQYALDIEVQDVQVAADAQSATLRARVTTNFTPKVGRASNASVTNTFQFERRGENWVIVGIR